MLEGEGYSVDIASDGTEGIRLGQSYDYAIAVIDLKMPDYDGLEVLKRIREKHPNTVCFIATAFASYDTAIDATRLGAFGYIPKPFTPEEFLYQIERGIENRKILVESEKLKQEREEKLLELAEEKSKLNTIINSINDGVLIVNKNKEVVYFNSSVLKNLDLDNLAIGDKAVQKLPSQVYDLLNIFFSSTGSSKKTLSKQIEIKPLNQLFVEVDCTPVPHPNGSFTGVVIVIRNITESKKIELIKNQFVSMVAHELKTPVAAVQGFLKIILDDNIKTTRDQELEFMSRSSIRLKGLLDLVNDLLDISRMELKTKQRELVELNLIEILKSSLGFLKFDIEKRNLEICEEYEEGIPNLKLDNNEITRLFTNIISNAIKYNKDGGKITVRVQRENNYINISISDSGIGMTENEKNNLFHEFYRAKNEFTRGISGTGLGLNIVKRIVESYNGKIEVTSEYKVGTTVITKLPININ